VSDNVPPVAAGAQHRKGVARAPGVSHLD